MKIRISDWFKPKSKHQTMTIFVPPRIRSYAIRCKGCGLVLTASTTTIESMQRMAIADGWLIGDGYQHCKNCRAEAVKRK